MGFSTFAAVFSYNLRLLALRHRPGVASLCALTMQHLQGQCYHSALSQEVWHLADWWYKIHTDQIKPKRHKTHPVTARNTAYFCIEHVLNLQHCSDVTAAQQSCSEEMPFGPATLIKSSCSGSWLKPNGPCAMWMPKVWGDSVIFGVHVDNDLGIIAGYGRFLNASFSSQKNSPYSGGKVKSLAVNPGKIGQVAVALENGLVKVYEQRWNSSQWTHPTILFRGKVRGVVIQLYLHFTLPLSNVGHCFAAVNRSARAQSCPVLFLEEGAELGSAKPDSCALTCVFSRQIHDENSMVAGSASSVAIRWRGGSWLHRQHIMWCSCVALFIASRLLPTGVGQVGLHV